LKSAVSTAHFKALQTPGKSEEKAFVRRTEGRSYTFSGFSGSSLELYQRGGYFFAYFLSARSERK